MNLLDTLKNRLTSRSQELSPEPATTDETPTVSETAEATKEAETIASKASPFSSLKNILGLDTVKEALAKSTASIKQAATQLNTGGTTTAPHPSADQADDADHTSSEAHPQPENEAETQSSADFRESAALPVDSPADESLGTRSSLASFLNPESVKRTLAQSTDRIRQTAARFNIGSSATTISPTADNADAAGNKHAGDAVSAIAETPLRRVPEPGHSDSIAPLSPEPKPVHTEVSSVDSDTAVSDHSAFASLKNFLGKSSETLDTLKSGALIDTWKDRLQNSLHQGSARIKNAVSGRQPGITQDTDVPAAIVEPSEAATETAAEDTRSDGIEAAAASNEPIETADNLPESVAAQMTAEPVPEPVSSRVKDMLGKRTAAVRKATAELRSERSIEAAKSALGKSTEAVKKITPHIEVSDRVSNLKHSLGDTLDKNLNTLKDGAIVGTLTQAADSLFSKGKSLFKKTAVGTEAPDTSALTPQSLSAEPVPESPTFEVPEAVLGDAASAAVEAASPFTQPVDSASEQQADPEPEQPPDHSDNSETDAIETIADVTVQADARSDTPQPTPTTDSIPDVSVPVMDPETDSDSDSDAAPVQVSSSDSNTTATPEYGNDPEPTEPMPEVALSARDTIETLEAARQTPQPEQHRPHSDPEPASETIVAAAVLAHAATDATQTSEPEAVSTPEGLLENENTWHVRPTHPPYSDKGRQPADTHDTEHLAGAAALASTGAYRATETTDDLPESEIDPNLYGSSQASQTRVSGTLKTGFALSGLLLALFGTAWWLQLNRGGNTTESSEFAMLESNTASQQSGAVPTTTASVTDTAGSGSTALAPSTEGYDAPASASETLAVTETDTTDGVQNGTPYSDITASEVTPDPSESTPLTAATEAETTDRRATTELANSDGPKPDTGLQAGYSSFAGAQTDSAPKPDTDASNVEAEPSETETLAMLSNSLDTAAASAEGADDVMDAQRQQLDIAYPVAAIADFLARQDSSLPTGFTLHGLNFETASSRLSRDSSRIVSDLATTLKAYPGTKIQLEGHTDNRGSAKANQLLSAARAKAVKAALIRLQIEPERMVATGQGETYPIADNGTVSGQSENRRVEVIITER